MLKNNIRTRKGKEFRKFALRNILTNPVYVKNDKDIVEYFENINQTIFTEKDKRKKLDGEYGLIAYNKTDSNKKERDISQWIIAVGLHEGFIKGKDWIQVQGVLERNMDKRYRSAINNKNETIFSGILKCAKCGHAMIPKSNKTNKNGETRYYYVCREKERTRRLNCDSNNVNGSELDKNFISILKDIFVPNSKVYEEFKNMSLTKENNEELEQINILKKQYEENQIKMKELVAKIRYIDIDVIDIINEELRNTKKKNEELQNKIDILEKRKDNKKCEKSSKNKGSKYVLNIIDNCFDTFEDFDLKSKKDIMNIFIESAFGNGDTIEINVLNTQMKEEQKKMICNQTLKKRL